jgi:hypothetical protein
VFERAGHPIHQATARQGIYKPFYQQPSLGRQGIIMPDGERRLAAIMYTNVVGYTPLGQRNESLSLELVEEQKKLSARAGPDRTVEVSDLGRVEIGSWKGFLGNLSMRHLSPVPGGQPLTTV